MIRQRILYVGIGGSGLDLGIELDAALKREICGLDGNALSRKGLAYSTNQLPSFVQQVYIDFAAAAIANVTKQLNGSNARAITNIIPKIGNYSDVAQSLRMRNKSEVESWLPGPFGEPTVNPLSAGAGQFPTVGRAALFQSIQEQGLDQAILGQIKDAVAALSGSMGELNLYTGGNNNYARGVTVYVGFSVSGGTGSGIFFDVLTMLINVLNEQIQQEPVTIIPAVLLPSTFDGVLGPLPLNRAKLNAATALVDLTSLIEQLAHLNAANASNAQVAYPNSVSLSLGAMNGSVRVPVAAVVTNPAGMNRSDTVRMLASAIVTQVSLSSSQSASSGTPDNLMTFGEKLVNTEAEITQNPRSVMHRPIMPMVSASLTVPSRKIADVIAKRLLAEAFTTDGGYFGHSDEVINETAVRILEYCGLGPLINGQTFAGTYAVQFDPPASIKSREDLKQGLVKLRARIESSAHPVINKQIESTIGNMTTFDLLEGMEQVLASDPTLSLPAVTAAAQRAVQILNSPSRPNSPKSSGSTARSTAKKKKKFIPSIKRRPTQQEIKKEFELLRNEFENTVKDQWWQQWVAVKYQWRNSVEAGSNRVSDLSGWWQQLVSNSNESAKNAAAELSSVRTGVKDFIPTHGLSTGQALSNIYSETKQALMTVRPIANQTPHNLVQTIIGQNRDGSPSALKTAVAVFRSSRTHHEFSEKVLDQIRSEIQGVLSHPIAGINPPFKSLAALLEEMVGASPGPDASELQAELGSLVPGVLIPTGRYAVANVNITYPGQSNFEIEKKLADEIFSSNIMRQLIGAGPADDGAALLQKSALEVAAVGDSDSVTVNVNLIGMTLFDHTEICEALRAWQSELGGDSIEKLEWRQRLDFMYPDRVLGVNSRTRILHQLLLGLWGGMIEIEKGSIENPEVLIIRDKDRQLTQSSLPRVELSTRGMGLTGWSSLLSSFERLLIDVGAGNNGFAQEVVAQLLQYVPEGLRESNPSMTPEIIEAVLDIRKSDLLKARQALANSTEFGSKAISSYKRSIHFWENEFTAAWSYRGRNLFAASLSVIRPLD